MSTRLAAAYPGRVKPRSALLAGVERCDDDESLAALTRRPARRGLYRAPLPRARTLPPLGFDRSSRRDDQGAGVSRLPAPRWRTKSRSGAAPPRRRLPYACWLALAAGGHRLFARRIDLLPDGRGRWTVAEINGAVEFTSDYALGPGADPFAEAAFRLGRAAICARLREPAPPAPALRP